MEEVLDHLEGVGDGPLHLEGEGIAVKPDSDDEEALEEVLDEESKVGSNACRALHFYPAQGPVAQLLGTREFQDHLAFKQLPSCLTFPG